MKLLSDLTIKCKNCERIITINKDGLEYDLEYLDEGQMGSSSQHVYCSETECPGCGSRLSFSLRYVEYPVGVLEMKDFKGIGCDKVEYPEVDMIGIK